ncbi:GNAT family N-acetyltransferase [Falsiroseomonas sp. HC035]|uniref:GNAT family N-acetyltransferase n=1 Tax=Falsiroseomonas sp. HC035 TaxID=3390999 RepID=UPI003D310455
MQDDYAARCAAGQAFGLFMDGRLEGLIVLEDLPEHLWIDNVAVEPALKGKGLGRRLMAFAEDEARRCGKVEIRLLTNLLMSANIHLYARLGYAETERREEAGFSRIYMAKRLA